MKDIVLENCGTLPMYHSFARKNYDKKATESHGVFVNRTVVASLRTSVGS